MPLDAPSAPRFSRSAFPVLLLALTACGGAGTEQPTEQRYAGVVALLSELVDAEMDQKGLPALSIALVDDQETVWAAGFGVQDPDSGVPATEETVYRVGSVSKLFTDIAVMQRVETGALDLDAPVSTYLPGFAPRNPFGGEITLRQLMSHRSGLVREPPVGHYFDPTQPSLRSTVGSLDSTTLVYAPASRHKYSNAAIAVVGYVLETMDGEPFADVLERTLLGPLGMRTSAFTASDRVTRNLARAVMWSYDGREFAAPTFELGMAPAGSMYSTVNDLARFLAALFAAARGAEGAVLTPAGLEAMWTPQFAEAGATEGRGLGFGISTLEGRRRVGHGGAIYGFSTELAALPDERLGVVVTTTRDFSNAVTTRIATEGLRLMLALRDGRRLVPPLTTEPLAPGRAATLQGRYRQGADGADLVARGQRLFLTPAHQGYRAEVRARGDDLVVDDRMSAGARVEVAEGRLRLGSDAFQREEWRKPDPPPREWEGLIGEYGWDHNVLFVFERDGRLWALIEWLELNPLEPVGSDVFAFPTGGGLYHGEQLRFERDATGRVTAAVAAGVRFARRAVGPSDGEVFRIDPVRPVAELRAEALAASPPSESGDFETPDLVDVARLEPGIRLDIRYAGTDNFMSTAFYEQPRAFLQRPAAEALARVHRALAAQGYGLLVHDAYRPWHVTRMFWDATPADMKIFVADPAQGSRHNRGAAVDLTLVDLATGRAAEMPGVYDEFSERSFPDYAGGTSRQRWLRELLRGAMEAEGFEVYPYEWWHFDFAGWERFPILNLAFGDLDVG